MQSCIVTDKNNSKKSTKYKKYILGHKFKFSSLLFAQTNNNHKPPITNDGGGGGSGDGGGGDDTALF
jgi:hypothetical protein